MLQLLQSNILVTNESLYFAYTKYIILKMDFILLKERWDFMNVSGINCVNAQNIPSAMPSKGTDPVSQSIQKQIADAQKQLQEIASDDRLSAEDKMKRRQEIQQQITSLNQQLRQHEIDLIKEQQEKIAEKADTTQTKENKLAQDSMKTMISADNALKQADVYDRVATQKEGQSNVLKAEIKLDESRGGNPEKKKEELANLEQEAQKVREQQTATLADVIQESEPDNDISISEKDESTDTTQGVHGSSEEQNEMQTGYKHIDIVVDNDTPAAKNEEDESEIDTYI